MFIGIGNENVSVQQEKPRADVCAGHESEGGN